MNLKLKLTLVFLAVLSQNVKSEVDVTVNKKEIVVREGKEIDLICSLQVNNFQRVPSYTINMFYKQKFKNWTTYKFQYMFMTVAYFSKKITALLSSNNSTCFSSKSSITKVNQLISFVKGNNMVYLNMFLLLEYFLELLIFS